MAKLRLGKKSSQSSQTRKPSKLSILLFVLIIILVVVYVFAKTFFFIAAGISAILLAFAIWNAFKDQVPATAAQLPHDIKVSVSMPPQ